MLDLGVQVGQSRSPADGEQHIGPGGEDRHRARAAFPNYEAAPSETGYGGADFSGVGGSHGSGEIGSHLDSGEIGSHPCGMVWNMMLSAYFAAVGHLAVTLLVSRLVGGT